MMKMLNRRTLLKRSAFTGIGLAGAAAFPGIRQALAQVGDYELVCNANGVRVRAEPGLSGAIVGSVNIGDGVWVTGESVEADGYLWIPMTVMGSFVAGYAASDFFDRPGGREGWVRGTPIHVTSDNVNLRSGAGLGHGVIASYNTGTNAVVNDGPTSADGYNWYNITIDGMTGWMVDAWLAEGHTGGDDPGGEFPVGSNVRPTDGLNLRSGAGTGHAVIGVYYPDSSATVVGGPQSADGYVWYQVEMWDDGNVGWFAGEFLQFSDSGEPTGARHRVFDGPLNIRNNPGLGAPVVAAVPTGDIFVVTDASFVDADGYIWMPMALESNPNVTGWVAQGFSEEIG